MSNSIGMDLLGLEMLPEALVTLTLDKEHTSLRWDHKSAKIILSCLPFPLEQQSAQISWSYIICTAPQTNTELDKLITDVKAQAQLLSDWGILPSSCEFGADSIVDLEPSASPGSWWSGSPNHESTHPLLEDARRATRALERRPRNTLSVSNLVNSVSEGAIRFLTDGDAKVTWKFDVRKLSPKETPQSEADLIAILNQASGRRCLLASFLLGCSLLTSRYGRGRHKNASEKAERSCKGLSRYVVSLLNSLFEKVGETAFKVLPAMAASGFKHPPASHFGQLSMEKCRLLGGKVALGLLCHDDQSWTKIDFKYIFDPAEMLQLADKTIDQTRASIGLRAGLDGLCAQPSIGSVNQVPAANPPSQGLPLPAILQYDSPIFIHVQEGDVDRTRELFTSASAHINTVDPFGLSLLYYASYYCCRACDVPTSLVMYTALINMGVDPEWRDEIGNTARETILDSAMMHFAAGRVEQPALLSLVQSVGNRDTDHVDGRGLPELLHWYEQTRNFNQVHQALLNLDGSRDPLKSRLDAAVRQCNIDKVDRSGRSSLAWAVEYRYVGGVQALLNFGASASFVRRSVCGDQMPLLHLLIAGPTDDIPALLCIVEALLRAGADIMATDSEG